MRAVWYLLLGLTAAIAPAATMAQHAVKDAGHRVTVFEGVNIVHIQDGQVATDQRLVVINNRIREMGSADDVPLPDNSRVIDARGWYVMPGLYEMHAHVPPHDAGEQRVKDVLRLYLANGITTIRGMLGEPWHLELRALLEDGDWIGPRLVTSGPSLNGRSVESAKQAQRMVAEQAAAGYDFLKLHPGLGPLTFDAIAREAQRRHIPFAGHVSVDVGLKRTLRAGQATIDHLDGYAQELLAEESPLRRRDPGFFGIAIANGLQTDQISAVARATREADVWNVPTQSLMENILGETAVEDLLARPEMAYVDAATRRQWERAVRGLREEYDAAERERFLHIRRLLIAALHDVGAGLLLGSDAPQIMNVPGFSIHQELELMVRSGLTAREALLTGSGQPARFFSESGQYGRIALGYVADLVFLRSNPLASIQHTREVRGVYHAGEWYSRDTLDGWLTAIAQRAQP